MLENDIYLEKLKLLEWLVRLQNKTVLKKFIELKETVDVPDFEEAFPVLTKQDLIERAELANKDIKEGRIYDIESIENENW